MKSLSAPSKAPVRGKEYHLLGMLVAFRPLAGIGPARVITLQQARARPKAAAMVLIESDILNILWASTRLSSAAF
jgi:hypothetical protein